MKIFQYGGRLRAIGTMWLTMWPATWPTEANENTRVARGTLSAITVGSSNLCTGSKFRAAAPNIVAGQNFSVVLDLFNGVWNSSSPHHTSWAERSQSMRNGWRRGRWWVSWLNPRKVQKKVMLRGVSQTRLRTRNWFWLATGASDKCVIGFGFGDPSRWHMSRRERESPSYSV